MAPGAEHEERQQPMTDAFTIAAHRPAGGSPQLPLSGSRRTSLGERQQQRMLQELAKLGRGCASVASANMAGRYILLGVAAAQAAKHQPAPAAANASAKLSEEVAELRLEIRLLQSTQEEEGHAPAALLAAKVKLLEERLDASEAGAGHRCDQLALTTEQLQGDVARLHEAVALAEEDRAAAAVAVPPPADGAAPQQPRALPGTAAALARVAAVEAELARVGRRVADVETGLVEVRSEGARAAVERAEADEDADGLAQRMADMEAAWQAHALPAEQVELLAALASGDSTETEGVGVNARGALATLQQRVHDLRSDLRTAVADSAAGCDSAQQKAERAEAAAAAAHSAAQAAAAELASVAARMPTTAPAVAGAQAGDGPAESGGADALPQANMRAALAEQRRAVAELSTRLDANAAYFQEVQNGLEEVGQQVTGAVGSYAQAQADSRAQLLALAERVGALQTVVDALPEAAESQRETLEDALASLRRDLDALAERADGAASRDALEGVRECTDALAAQLAERQAAAAAMLGQIEGLATEQLGVVVARVADLEGRLGQTVGAQLRAPSGERGTATPAELATQVARLWRAQDAAEQRVTRLETQVLPLGERQGSSQHVAALAARVAELTEAQEAAARAAAAQHHQAEALGEAAATMSRVVGRLTEQDCALAALRSELTAVRQGAGEREGGELRLELANQDTAVSELRRQLGGHAEQLEALHSFAQGWGAEMAGLRPGAEALQEVRCELGELAGQLEAARAAAATAAGLAAVEEAVQRTHGRAERAEAAAVSALRAQADAAGQVAALAAKLERMEATAAPAGALVATRRDVAAAAERVDALEAAAPGWDAAAETTHTLTADLVAATQRLGALEGDAAPAAEMHALRGQLGELGSRVGELGGRLERAHALAAEAAGRPDPAPALEALFGELGALAERLVGAERAASASASSAELGALRGDLARVQATAELAAGRADPAPALEALFGELAALGERMHSLEAATAAGAATPAVPESVAAELVALATRLTGAECAAAEASEAAFEAAENAAAAGDLAVLQHEAGLLASRLAQTEAGMLAADAAVGELSVLGAHASELARRVAALEAAAEQEAGAGRPTAQDLAGMRSELATLAELVEGRAVRPAALAALTNDTACELAAVRTRLSMAEAATGAAAEAAAAAAPAAELDALRGDHASMRGALEALQDELAYVGARAAGRSGSGWAAEELEGVRAELAGLGGLRNQVAALAGAVTQLQAEAAASAAPHAHWHDDSEGDDVQGGGLARQLSLAEGLRAELGELRERLLGAAADADARLAGLPDAGDLDARVADLAARMGGLAAVDAERVMETRRLAERVTAAEAAAAAAAELTARVAAVESSLDDAAAGLVARLAALEAGAGASRQGSPDGLVAGLAEMQADVAELREVGARTAAALEPLGGLPGRLGAVEAALGKVAAEAAAAGAALDGKIDELGGVLDARLADVEADLGDLAGDLSVRVAELEEAVGNLAEVPPAVAAVEAALEGLAGVPQAVADMQAELERADPGAGGLLARLRALESATEEVRGAVRAAVAQAASERGASSVWLAAVEANAKDVRAAAQTAAAATADGRRLEQRVHSLEATLASALEEVAVQMQALQQQAGNHPSSGPARRGALFRDDAPAGKPGRHFSEHSEADFRISAEHSGAAGGSTTMPSGGNGGALVLYDDDGFDHPYSAAAMAEQERAPGGRPLVIANRLYDSSDEDGAELRPALRPVLVPPPSPPSPGPPAAADASGRSPADAGRRSPLPMHSPTPAGRAYVGGPVTASPPGRAPSSPLPMPSPPPAGRRALTPKGGPFAADGGDRTLASSERARGSPVVLNLAGVAAQQSPPRPVSSSLSGVKGSVAQKAAMFERSPEG
ncbi:hypothetical protein WJX81_004130 [Elliptochloris bilobata]|uniref:Kinesin motor domain-containing protein n=1 Tax=Elliptochloris bilobata TaxID=381761 RepID=A0AAW1S8X2_9CHLO